MIIIAITVLKCQWLTFCLQVIQPVLTLERGHIHLLKFPQRRDPHSPSSVPCICPLGSQDSGLSLSLILTEVCSANCTRVSLYAIPNKGETVGPYSLKKCLIYTKITSPYPKLHLHQVSFLSDINSNHSNNTCRHCALLFSLKILPVPISQMRKSRPESV